MRGWVLVGPAETAEDDGLSRWIETGIGFAAGLPPK
jgi:hypothetical protein